MSVACYHTCVYKDVCLCLCTVLYHSPSEYVFGIVILIYHYLQLMSIRISTLLICVTSAQFDAWQVVLVADALRTFTDASAVACTHETIQEFCGCWSREIHRCKCCSMEFPTMIQCGTKLWRCNVGMHHIFLFSMTLVSHAV
jgi:hypothetical protein